MDGSNEKLVKLEMPPEFEGMSQRLKAEGDMWNSITYTATPDDQIESREGSGGKMLDYIKQFYVIRELNRLFPGWTVENWKMWYQPEVATWVFTGELVVEYPSFKTNKMEVRRVPGVGAQVVQVKKDSGDSLKPSQPDDMAKASRTEFIKNAAYWLGIGFDIYSQEIPMSLRAEFEDICRAYEHSAYIQSLASTITTPKTFKQLLNTIPDAQQARKLKEILDDFKDLVQDTSVIWDTFQRQSRATADIFLDKIFNSLNNRRTK